MLYHNATLWWLLLISMERKFRGLPVVYQKFLALPRKGDTLEMIVCRKDDDTYTSFVKFVHSDFALTASGPLGNIEDAITLGIKLLAVNADTF